MITSDEIKNSYDHKKKAVKKIADVSESPELPCYVDDLVLLVRRLVHRLNQCSPTDPLVNKALDYLRRNGHQSSPLK